MPERFEIEGTPEALDDLRKRLRNRDRRTAPTLIGLDTEGPLLAEFENPPGVERTPPSFPAARLQQVEALVRGLYDGEDNPPTFKIVPLGEWVA